VSGNEPSSKKGRFRICSRISSFLQLCTQPWAQSKLRIPLVERSQHSALFLQTKNAFSIQGTGGYGYNSLAFREYEFGSRKRISHDRSLAFRNRVNQPVS
jgi:hypothetical protein